MGVERQQRAGKSAFACDLPWISLSEGFWPQIHPFWAGFEDQLRCSDTPSPQGLLEVIPTAVPLLAPSTPAASAAP